MKKKYIYILTIILLCICIYSLNKYKVFKEAYADSLNSQLEQMELAVFLNKNSIKDSVLTEEIRNSIEFMHVNMYNTCVDIENAFPYKLSGEVKTLRSEELKAYLEQRVEKLYNEDINIVQIPLKEYYVQLHKDLKDLIKQREDLSTSKWLNKVKDFLQSGRRP